jgi:hypothetical protein
MAIDTSPVQAQFLNGNPLSDGMANFATALIQAPIAADQIRRQQADKDVAQAWQRKEFDQRKTQADQAQSNWLDNFKAQMAQRQIENTRQDESQQLSRARDFGIAPPMALAPTDLNRALWSAADVGKKDRARADRKSSLDELAMLFKAGGVGGAGTVKREGWASFKDENNVPMLYHRGTGAVIEAKPGNVRFNQATGEMEPIPGAMAAPIEAGKDYAGVPAQGTGQDGSVAFPTPTPDASRIRDWVLNANAYGNPIALLSRLFGAQPERGANAGPAAPPAAIPQAMPTGAKPPVSLSRAKSHPAFAGMSDDQIRALAAQQGRVVTP